MFHTHKYSLFYDDNENERERESKNPLYLNDWKFLINKKRTLTLL